jgi:hypothetical protein
MILLIDGDVLCYTACWFATKPFYDQLKKTAWKQATGEDLEDVSNVKLKAKDEYGNTIIPEMTRDEHTYYLKACYKEVHRILEDLYQRYWLTDNDALIAVGGDYNFRKDIYSEYKMNRHGVKKEDNRLKFVPMLRNILEMEGVAIKAHGYEADDFIRIWAEEARKYGLLTKIVSIDKDLRCIIGTHVNPKDFSEIVVDESTAMELYYGQLLQGDATDNIPGLPGIGPVKAKRLLESCKTELDYQEAVVNAYINQYGVQWADYLLANGKLLHILRDVDDYFVLWEWTNEIR